jgi:hypothetical protein
MLDDLILKVKEEKLSTLLREFNAIKNQQPNSAAIVLRTIVCLIIQEKAKLAQPGGALAIRHRTRERRAVRYPGPVNHAPT